MCRSTDQRCACFPCVLQSYRVAGSAVAAASGAEDWGCQEAESCSQYERHDLEVPGLGVEVNHRHCCQDLPKPDKKTRLSDLIEMRIHTPTTVGGLGKIFIVFASLKSKKIPKVKQNAESF